MLINLRLLKVRNKFPKINIVTIIYGHISNTALLIQYLGNGIETSSWISNCHHVSILTTQSVHVIQIPSFIFGISKGRYTVMIIINGTRTKSLHKITFHASLQPTKFHMFTQTLFPGKIFLARRALVLLYLQVYVFNVSLMVVTPATTVEYSLTIRTHETT